eukprot:2049637-Pyramimonas_sp.AAC.1
MGTCNAHSLRGDSAPTASVSRLSGAESLRVQLRDSGFHALGAQEARATEGARAAGGFLTLAGGSDKGNLGC